MEETKLQFNEQGLIPAIAQDADTGQVLMVAHMSRESLAKTFATGEAWFWSRRRGELWHKGQTSGNVLKVERVLVDCDGDVLLLQVRPTGPACHTGERSCFYQELGLGGEVERLAAADSIGPEVLRELFEVIRQRQRERPEGSYTVRLLEEGVDKIGKKLGEEATESVIAAKNGEPRRIAEEFADLFYHSLVMLAATGVEPGEVWRELKRRRK